MTPRAVAVKPSGSSDALYASFLDAIASGVTGQPDYKPEGQLVPFTLTTKAAYLPDRIRNRADELATRLREELAEAFPAYKELIEVAVPGDHRDVEVRSVLGGNLHVALVAISNQHRKRMESSAEAAR